MLRLAECLPAMTPSAVLGLPWRFAWSLIHTKSAENDQAYGDDGGGSGGHRLPRVEPLPRQGGGHHPPGMSQLYGMFGG